MEDEADVHIDFRYGLRFRRSLHFHIDFFLMELTKSMLSID